MVYPASRGRLLRKSLTDSLILAATFLQSLIVQLQPLGIRPAPTLVTEINLHRERYPHRARRAPPPSPRCASGRCCGRGPPGRSHDDPDIFHPTGRRPRSQHGLSHRRYGRPSPSHPRFLFHPRNQNRPVPTLPQPKPTRRAHAGLSRPKPPILATIPPSVELSSTSKSTQPPPH